MARHDPISELGARALEAAEGLISEAGASADGVTIGTALLQPSAGNVATVGAIRVEGADAHAILDNALGVMHPEMERPRLQLDWLAGRTVFRVRDQAITGTYPVIVYAVGDTVWFVNAGGPLREGLLAQLPPPSPPSAARFELASVFPTVFGGVPRDLLTLRSGSWSMPAATLNRLDTDGLSEEVVLMTGAGMYELNTASGLATRAGLLPGATAWQVTGADEELMVRLRDEILVPRIGRGQASTEVVVVAGRELLRLTSPRGDGSGQRLPDAEVNLYLSGDAIWWLEAEGEDLTDLLEQLP